jgi:hypothetical protein
MAPVGVSFEGVCEKVRVAVKRDKIILYRSVGFMIYKHLGF